VVSEHDRQICDRINAENAVLDADPRFPQLKAKYEQVCSELVAVSNARLELKTGKPISCSDFRRVGDKFVLTSLDEDGDLTIQEISPNVPPPKSSRRKRDC